MEKRNFYTQEDSYKTFLWALLLPQAVSVVLALVFSFFYTKEQLSNSLIYIFIVTILAQSCFAFIIYYYNKKQNINIKTAIKFIKPINLKNVFICILISIVAVFGFVNFINMISNFLTKIGFNQPEISLPINTFYWFVINIILLAIIPAIMEEIIFRGMIYNGLREKGVIIATLFSAIMFAIIHLSVKQLIFPFVMGIVFCLVLEKTGSIIYTMIVHFCNNFIVLLISYISTKVGYNFLAINTGSIFMKILVTLIAGIALILIWLLIKLLKAKETDKTIKTDTQILKDQTNNLTNNNNKVQYNKCLIGSLLCGVIIWFVYALSELIL